ncbi:hydroxyisourate hydrolase [Rhodococcus rhodnii]|uniref:5-hydroxyisourate hydrolase n=2 Tax=Rhodococcus rhodnii TaxID=38312 RepID=R7WM34_9NOCA|nr:hydroxyisourate hydrolase [Rhodococcus rhodnii]EOM76353.1 transthyretin-like protein [Rhodococcus rhodnii LMG 5362]TXG89226.1 hydroxyisourate hydrolase [Rhodococcus rhodnii]
MSKTLSTHVLDAVSGDPAVDVAVRVESGGAVVASGRTDDDGRIATLADAPLPAGTYRIVFDSGEYFERSGTDHFYPEVIVTFRSDGSGRGYHVPILLSPFAYSTYRGS